MGDPSIGQASSQRTPTTRIRLLPIDETSNAPGTFKRLLTACATSVSGEIIWSIGKLSGPNKSPYIVCKYERERIRAIFSGVLKMECAT